MCGDAVTNEERSMKRFEIRSDIKATTLPSLRISVEDLNKIREISGRDNVPIQEVVRQMIKFAIESMANKETP